MRSLLIQVHWNMCKTLERKLWSTSGSCCSGYSEFNVFIGQEWRVLGNFLCFVSGIILVSLQNFSTDERVFELLISVFAIASMILYVVNTTELEGRKNRVCFSLLILPVVLKRQIHCCAIVHNFYKACNKSKNCRILSGLRRCTNYAAEKEWW